MTGSWACYCIPPEGCRAWPPTVIACPDCGRLQPPYPVTRLTFEDGRRGPLRSRGTPTRRERRAEADPATILEIDDQGGTT